MSKDALTNAPVDGEVDQDANHRFIITGEVPVLLDRKDQDQPAFPLCWNEDVCKNLERGLMWMWRP